LNRVIIDGRQTFFIPKWVFYRIVNGYTYIKNCKNYKDILLMEMETSIWGNIVKGLCFSECLNDLERRFRQVPCNVLFGDLDRFISQLILDKMICLNPSSIHSRLSESDHETQTVDRPLNISPIPNDDELLLYSDEETIISDNGKYWLRNALLELTYDCTLQCKHCYAISNDSFDDRKELTTSDWIDVLNQLYLMNVQNLTFTGGDVFLREDFWRLYDYAIEKKFVVTIFTNGQLLTESEIVHLAQTYPESIQLTLFSSNPEIHDSITNVRGSFFKTLSTINRLKAKGITCVIKSQITSLNQDSLEGLLDLCRDLNVNPQISYSVLPKWNSKLSSTDYNIYNEELLRSLLAQDEDYFYKGDNKYPEGNKELNSEDGLCGAGINSLTIGPMGEYKACISIDKEIGKYPEPISMIWDNNPFLKKLRSLRLKDLAECCSCKYISYCNHCIGDSWIEHHDLVHKVFRNCQIAKIEFELSQRQYH
jgi:radical SAM protein with 4Fe4S-binding SPASM domain